MSHSLYWIYSLLFFSSLYFMTTFCGLFSVWYWYHCFFLLGGMKMSGSAGIFNKKFFFFKKIIFFYLVGSPKVGGAGDGKHKKKYGHPNPKSNTLCLLSSEWFGGLDPLPCCTTILFITLPKWFHIYLLPLNYRGKLDVSHITFVVSFSLKQVKITKF